MSLSLVPLTLSQANELIAAHHRHHKPVVGHRFTIGARHEESKQIVGAAVTGRPVSRELDQYMVAEVTRLVADGTPHVCSTLYAASARAAKAMGYTRIQTYILESETGVSLMAAGWYRIKADGTRCICAYALPGRCTDCVTKGGDWNHSKSRNGKRRTDQPMGKKQRWGKWLN